MNVTNPPVPELPDFWDQLKRHDWFYAMSDDPRPEGAYHRGRRDYERLRLLAKDGGAEYEALMSAFSAHYHAQVSGSEVPPLPERPA